MAGYFGEEYTPSLTPQNNIIISNQTDLGDESMNCPDTDKIEPAGAAVVYNKYNPNKAVNTVANEGINTISGVNAGVVIVRVNGVSYKVIL